MRKGQADLILVISFDPFWADRLGERPLEWFQRDRDIWQKLLTGAGTSWNRSKCLESVTGWRHGAVSCLACSSSIFKRVSLGMPQWCRQELWKLSCNQSVPKAEDRQEYLQGATWSGGLQVAPWESPRIGEWKRHMEVTEGATMVTWNRSPAERGDGTSWKAGSSLPLSCSFQTSGVKWGNAILS